MTHILIVSLGNSPEPVINCINSLRPKRTVFVCTDGTRQLIESVRQKARLADFDPERDLLQLQQRLQRKDDQETINELDQLDRVYTLARDLIQQLRAESPGCQITLDYTGGTKTMAAALAMAAVDDGQVKLSLTTHERLKNQSTINGYSVPVNVSMVAIQARRLLDQELPQLLHRYDYSAAEQAVQRIALLPDQDAATRSVLRRLQDLLAVLDAWDRFDHLQAVQVLQGLGDRTLDQNLLFPLKRVIGSRRLLDTEADNQKWPHMRGHGLEAVEDLILNAERRACQDRFDDGVGRLYRGLELAAQLSLKLSFGIETAAVDLTKLPDPIREIYTERKELLGGEPLKLALTAAYDLLAELEHPIGLLWADQRSELIDSLRMRNASLFAHGFRSIDYAAWRSFHDVITGFLGRVINLAQAERQSPLLEQLPAKLTQIL